MPVTYCDRAYKEVMTWTADTKIKYAPNRKSGKSFVRYGKYMKAKTAGESLALGSFGLDLLFDFEKGLLWSTGGPKRQRPPNVPLKQDGKADLAKMTRTDIMLGKMYAKWKMWKANFKILEENGMTRQDLKKMNDDQDPDGGKDSIIVALGRRKAQERAKQILASGRQVTETDVLECLQLWGFKENMNRGNVMPEGHKFVHSDTIGIIKMSTCERMLLTCGTKRYPEFTQVITKWLHTQLPGDLKDKFAYTSININKNYAGRLHRDGNNAGPSFIKAFGNFKGGDLNYWPLDDRNTELEDFDYKDKVSVNIKDNLLLFDGNRGHCVNSFKGERYSLVFFSMRAWNKIPAADAAAAKRCGIPLPTKKTMKFAVDLLPRSKKDGYRICPNQTATGVKRVASSEPKVAPTTKRRIASPCFAR